jgi:hypothetical protein
MVMTSFAYAESSVPIRPDIPDAHRAYWERLAAPGSWWTGAQRVAIARETRNAFDCAFCRARRAALSPYAVNGTHDHGNGLSDLAVDAVHRVVTDQSRITRAWIDDMADQGLSRPAYVELVGVVVAVLSIDEFHRGLGLPLEPLPEPQPGAISRYTPAHLSEDMGFVPTIPADGAVGPEADLWAERTANVLRALSLVPDAVRAWRDLSDAQYLSFTEMQKFDQNEGRSLNRMQIELVAGRVSSVNDCFY